MLNKFPRELKKLKKIVNHFGFKFIVIFHNHYSITKEIKNFLLKEFPQKRYLDLKAENSSYEELSGKIYSFNSGFVFINDFENVLNNENIYPGFNQRRDKLAKHDIQLICFVPLFKEEKILRMFLHNLPDLWEFRTVIRIDDEIEIKTENSFEFKNMEITYSSLGGYSVEGKRKEIQRLKDKLESITNIDSKRNVYQQIVTIYNDLGDYDNAFKYQKRILSIFEELYKENPNDIEFKSGLAVSFSELGDIYSTLGDFDKSLQCYKDYNNVMKELYNKNPNNVRIKNILAISFSKLGDIYSTLGNSDKALHYYKDYNRLEKELYNENSTHIGFKNNLAVSYAKLGVFYNNQNNKEESCSYFNKAKSLWEELRKVSPQSHEFKKNLDNVKDSLKQLGC